MKRAPDFDMIVKSLINHMIVKSLINRKMNIEKVYNILFNLYCEIFGTSSFGEGRTDLFPSYERVRLRHMNECRIFHNINSITYNYKTICFSEFETTRKLIMSGNGCTY